MIFKGWPEDATPLNTM